MDGHPLSRLVGLETEYAIRFSTSGSHPGNDRIFHVFKDAIAQRVAARPGFSAAGRDQFFTDNGGAFYYEFLPQCLHGGLIEGATPECRGPTQAVLYQRAQEEILRQALPAAQVRLAAAGYPGELGLLKNCRDIEDHVYGSQENYEVDIASGFRLGCLRLGLVLLLPVLLLQVILVFGFLLLSLIAVSVALLIAACLPMGRRQVRRLMECEPRKAEKAIGQFVLRLSLFAMWPIAYPLCLLLRGLAFRPLRRQSLPFLVTRAVFSGAGSLAEDRQFHVAEKATAICRPLRASARPVDRSIFDVGNLLKGFCAPFNLQLAPIATLFRRRQRLQLGFGDSNRCQTAEWLKVGTTTLVLDMIEAGFLSSAPHLPRPIEALHQVAKDSTLRQTLDTDQGSMTALEIQRFYLQQARAYLRQCQTASMEARQVVELWQETLDRLEAQDFAPLVGKIDWVSKRFLLEECSDETDEVLRTIDLRYHELVDGYYEGLQRAVPEGDLLQPKAVRHAMRSPPGDTPAHFRGTLIRDQMDNPLPVAVSWESARIGHRLTGKIIPFRRSKPP